MRSFRALIAAALALSLILVLSGCTTQNPTIAKTDKLVVCVDGTNELVSTYVRWMINEEGGPFRAAYPEVEVEIVEIPNPATDPQLYETARRKLWTELMSGKGPDLLFLDSPTLDFEGVFPDVEKAMRNGMFADLSELYTDPITGKTLIDIAGREDVILDNGRLEGGGYTDVMLDAGRVDGKQFVMPIRYSFTTVTTNDITYEKLGITDNSGTVDMLAGLRRAFSTSGAGRMAVAAGGFDGSVLLTHEDGFPNDIFLNPYNYTSQPIVDYAAEEINIDTRLMRETLETGKLLREHSERLRSEGWLRPSQAYSEAVSGGFGEYVRSEDYVIVSNEFMSQWREGPFVTNFYGFLPHVDAIPAEDGGITATVTSYAAIRANSPNKLNAMRYLGMVLPGFRTLFYDKVFHTNFNDYTQGTKQIVDLSTFSGHWRDDELNVQSGQAIERTIELWKRVTTTRFPVPKEVTDIIAQYYDDEIGLDTAIRLMEDYWHISLTE